MAGCRHDDRLGWGAQRIGGLRARERGGTAVGYAILGGIVAVLLVGGVSLLVGSVGARLVDTGCAIAGPAPGKDKGDGNGHGHGYGRGRGHGHGHAGC